MDSRAALAIPVSHRDMHNARKTRGCVTARNPLVRMKRSSQEPSSEIEHITIAMLRQEDAIPLHLLVQRVAGELLEREVHEGASLLELGLFGSTLFVPLVIEEIKARNGTLWEIEEQS